MELPTGGFPSGHALNLTAIFGFLIYLAIVLVRDVRWRSLLVAVLASPILMICGIWLALTIWIYRWAKDRFSGGSRSHDRTPNRRDGRHDDSPRHAPGARPPASGLPARPRH
jgi:hypothetical protein